MRAAGLLMLLLAGAACTRERSEGPEVIMWDRDACTACGMVISDHQFATEVRGGPGHKLYRFDDVGCAAGWLRKQAWATAPGTVAWVAQGPDGHWVDALAARYEPGAASPMGFNLTASGADGGLTFADVTAQALRQRHH